MLRLVAGGHDKQRPVPEILLAVAIGSANEERLDMNSAPQLDLLPGDWVVVRSEEEILATLDDSAALEGLVFMPEMLAFCGQRFQVYKRADKTCDTIQLTGMLRMHSTVHLRMLRCNGAAHGDCQAGCLFFWKEAWLRRADDDGRTTPAGDATTTQRSAGRPPRDRAWLESTTVRQVPDSDETHFRCQATELPNATCPLKWWKPVQYVLVVGAQPGHPGVQ